MQVTIVGNSNEDFERVKKSHKNNENKLKDYEEELRKKEAEI